MRAPCSPTEPYLLLPRGGTLHTQIDLPALSARAWYLAAGGVATAARSSVWTNFRTHQAGGLTTGYSRYKARRCLAPQRPGGFLRELSSELGDTVGFILSTSCHAYDLQFSRSSSTLPPAAPARLLNSAEISRRYGGAHGTKGVWNMQLCCVPRSQARLLLSRPGIREPLKVVATR